MTELPLPQPGLWVLLDTTPVWAGETVDGVIAKVATPTGRQIDREILRSRFSDVGCLVINSEDQILLARRHPFTTARWGWQLPVCDLAPGGDGAVAAAREVEATCGWRVRDAVAVGAWALWPEHTDHVRHLVVAQAHQQVGGHDPREIAATNWIARSDLSQVLAEVADSFTFAAVLWWAMGSITRLTTS
jgi:hypothetical protein